APAELHSRRIGVIEIGRQLFLVIVLDPRLREAQRLERRRLTLIHRGPDLGCGYAERRRREVELIEALRLLDQRRITTRPHSLDDRRRRGIDIGGELAFGGEEFGERRREILAAAVELKRH